jgi:hypothetical protein
MRNNMEGSTARSASRSSVELTACLRLSRGSSHQPLWLLHDVAGGTTITVGSAASCDWQVRAAHVAPHALSVLLIGGAVFVAAGPNADARLNGAPLPEAWTQVLGAARIDLGLARLTLTWDEKPRASDASRGEASTERGPAAQRIPGERSGRVRIRAPEEIAARVAAMRAQPKAARARNQPESDDELESQRRWSWADRLSRPSLFDAPAVLPGREAVGYSPARLMVFGVLTALAYTGFVLWLDWN